MHHKEMMTMKNIFATSTIAGAPRRRVARWTAVLGALLVLALAGGTATGVGPLATRAARGQQATEQGATARDTIKPFPVSGLPAGTATGVPVHATFPAGTNLKHIHGGPAFVYVIAGSLDIVETDGSRTTYPAGSFFWEGPGHIHTLVVADSAEVFLLYLLPPGAEALVPVQ
jgi:quercetin dioxygenase-like cupin family protein